MLRQHRLNSLRGIAWGTMGRCFWLRLHTKNFVTECRVKKYDDRWPISAHRQVGHWLIRMTQRGKKKSEREVRARTMPLRLRLNQFGLNIGFCLRRDLGYHVAIPFPTSNGFRCSSLSSSFLPFACMLYSLLLPHLSAPGMPRLTGSPACLFAPCMPQALSLQTPP